jgi:hypothetical protein
MPYESGYYKISLDDWSPTTNPSETSDPFADKKVVPVVTLTETITQHWAVRDSDKVFNMRWARMSYTDKEKLKELYEDDYTSYVFTDIYNESYNVVITFFESRRITQLDSDGFSVELHLQCV